MTKLIPLSKQGKNKGKYFATVSDEDFERVSAYRWCYAHTFNNLEYAVRTNSGKTIYLHRFIMNLSSGNQGVDHIDGDGLNNTRENLRIATPSQNRLNDWKHRRKFGRRDARRETSIPISADAVAKLATLAKQDRRTLNDEAAYLIDVAAA